MTKETIKVVVRKIIINLVMLIICVTAGFAVATAMYSAGVHLNIPKITIEYSNTNYDLQLNTTADSIQPVRAEDAEMAAK